MADLERLTLIRDLRMRDLDLAEADLFEAEGQNDYAAWKRAQAAGDTVAARQHWARGIARAHLRDGSVPDEYEREAILAAMEQLRAERSAS
jgi:hypothetical protein